MQRVLFRDADSVISRREAAAVDQWLASGKRFHMMRDASAHTELMLAGLWGTVAGSLPPLQQLMQHFRFGEGDRHFADQDFLRQVVWPYARASIMQHDSIFGFMNAAPFPIPRASDDVPIGFSEGGAGTLAVKSNQPDGSEITWVLFQIEKIDDSHSQEKPVCLYTSTVQGGMLKVPIPRRYAQWVQQCTACVRLVENSGK
ncbi:MAG: hypothetical protein LBH10_05055 [Burkholderiaceae bacterium]|jgi:hypothetical protein|nr:hypothetical protein [Burkholderiaceae bacterium]